MLVNSLNQTKSSFSHVFAHENDEVTAIYGGLNYSNVIYYAYDTINGVPPLSFKSNGEAIEDYTIEGNTLQDGTPTPEAPVDVVGCGVRTMNLLYKKIEGCSISSGGVIAANESFYVAIAKVVQGETYSTVETYMAFYTAEPTIGSISYDSSRIVASTFVAPITGYVAVRYPSDYSNEMLNAGSTYLPYEPYGYKLPLTIGGTEYPIYLGQVPTTRRIRKLVLTGEEEWTEVTGKKYWISVTNYQKNGLITKCTHYIGVDNGNGSSVFTNGTIGFYSSGANRLMICDTSQSDVESFKQFLAAQYSAGTPVTVWYVLATPETAVVNEPLQKIGNYADTINYIQSGIAIPTINGTNTLAISTTVSPSNVEATGRIKRIIEGS